ncbi:MAG: pyridoxamine 5'-phosphate oxidase family protein [Burkholderiales bacterium]|nr:pyridoxamine 5'-phosphate oxidase family protein [Burkholderiales bacterium]
MPVLATATEDGGVDARTVVLRRVDAALGTLVFFTDQRSRKVADVGHRPSAMLVFWRNRLRWQLRALVHVSVQGSGPEVDALWQRVRRSASSADYLSPAAPGTPRADAVGLSKPLVEASYFTVLPAQVTEMDWLVLGSGAIGVPACCPTHGSGSRLDRIPHCTPARQEGLDLCPRVPVVKQVHRALVGRWLLLAGPSLQDCSRTEVEYRVLITEDRSEPGSRRPQPYGQPRSGLGCP